MRASFPFLLMRTKVTRNTPTLNAEKEKIGVYINVLYYNRVKAQN